MQHPHNLLGRCAVGVLTALFVQAAHAQIVDEIDIRREGADAVLQVRFATEVQFVRSIATRSGDLLLVSYNLLTLTNSRLPVADQVQRVRAERGLGAIEVVDEVDRGERARRLVLRFAEPTQASARAGRGNRTLEVVFKGRGAAIQALAAPASPRLPLTAARPPSTPPAAPVRPTAPVAPSAGAAPATPTAPAAAAAAAPPPDTPTPPASPAPVTAAPAPADPVAGAPPRIASTASPEVQSRADALMLRARAALEAQRWVEAIDALSQLLELPPNPHTAEAQEAIGRAHLANQDPVRARAEWETYLQLFPQGEGAGRVRRALAALPAARPAAAVATPPEKEQEVTIAGSASSTYYGGNGQIRSRDFQDSPISGLPQVAGEPQLSSDHSRQLYTDVDFNWRRRNAELDQRFVLRDSYAADLVRSSRNRNRLSALYFDHKSLAGGWGLRVGRQSPTGGGVMGRFDGISASWTVRPRMKIGVVAGDPTDRFFDSRRRFVGTSFDADRLWGNLGGGVYAIQQKIDGEIDRRAIGLDLRWFEGGATVFSQFDYDTTIRGLNIATVQGTLIGADNVVWNALYDRRALTTLALGNALTFGDPSQPGVLFRRIAERLLGTTVEALRDQIRRTTPMVTQAQLGVTKPWTRNWQTGLSVQLTSTGAIPPVPEVAGFEQGRPATGNIVTTSAQLIGLNLYSARDTHVLSTSVIRSPTLQGLLVAYNNSSFVAEVWQLEPSLQFYRDRLDGSRSTRWTPGLRITYRGWKRLAIESALTYELGSATRTAAVVDPGTGATTTEESTRRVNYSLGVRVEF